MSTISNEWKHSHTAKGQTEVIKLALATDAGVVESEPYKFNSLDEASAFLKGVKAAEKLLGIN